MSEFQVYLQVGLEHILDLNGFDHILFIIALAALYQIEDWKRILILVTAFTLGHSITLALATFDMVKVNSPLIEFLIPVTILITALANLFQKESATSVGILNYLFAGFFGLIHGLGFSSYLKMLLGRESSVAFQLFAFNVGIEAGQIVIVAAILALGFLFTSIFSVAKRDWKMVVSSLVAGMAILMVKDAIFWT